MGDLNDIGQKIKGKMQKVKGDLQMNASSDTDFGTKIKGGISKMKGSLNETIADAKLRSRNERRRNTK